MENSDLSKQDFSVTPQHSIQQILKRNGTTVPFDQAKITVAIHKAAGAVGIHDQDLCTRLSNEVVWYLHQGGKGNEKSMPTVEETQDIVEKVLIENGRAAIAKAYILYRDQRARQRRLSKDQSGHYYSVIPYQKLWQILNWNVEHECETIAKLNNHIHQGTISELVMAAETAYNEDIENAARAISERKNEVRIVIIAGPSSSGKTTTTIKLGEKLQKEGLKLIAVNIDNYFFDLDCHPRDQFGDYDFETPEALDLQLINQHLRQLLDGKTVQCPRYNFKTGKRQDNAEALQLHENEIILIDSLHGLYEPMTASVAENHKFKLYIETLSQLKDADKQFIRWTDIRLLRRMTRDQRQRAYDPRMTIEHWHYVRRSELKHIIPYNYRADYIVNGSLGYELAVLKKYMFHFFPQFVANYRNDPAHQDAYIRAQRIHNLFTAIATIDNDDEIVPQDSLLREFIGGSSYTYHV